MKIHLLFFPITLFGIFTFTVAIEFRNISSFCLNGQLIVCFREKGLEMRPGVVTYSLDSLAVVETTCINPAEKSVEGFNSSSQASITFTGHLTWVQFFEVAGCFSNGYDYCPQLSPPDCPPPLRPTSTCRYTNIVATDTIHNVVLDLPDATCHYNIYCTYFR